MPAAPTRTSDQLIDAALASGEIDWQTALVYKVFAAFSDPRLPARFKGDDTQVPDSNAVAEVQARYAELSAETQALVNPFLLPPIYEGSWADPSVPAASPSVAPAAPALKPPACGRILTTRWNHVDGTHVRIWWLRTEPGDAVVAQTYLLAMRDTIWNSLTGLMGRAPLSDAAQTCSGGDGRLDIYLTPSIERSFTAAFNTPGCKQTPAFIVMNPVRPVAILAHEFMHAIQWGYKTRNACMYPGDYAWLAEATATWAQDYVYPDDNGEHKLFPRFFHPNIGEPLEEKDDWHEYGAYIFFLFLTKSEDQDALISKIWANTEGMGSIAAVDSAIPGNLESVWSKFALATVNVPPFDYYRRWDNLDQHALATRGTVTVKGLGAWESASFVPHLGLIIDDYVFSGENARLVTFINGHTYKLEVKEMDETIGLTQVNDGTKEYSFLPASEEQKSGLRVQALFKIEGQADWQWEDWTDKPYVSFCRDAKAERLEELVVVISISDQVASRPPLVLNSGLQVSDIGCWRYTGTASEALISQADGSSMQDVQQANDVVFERADAHPDVPYPYLTFRVSSGRWQRDLTISGNGCYGHETDDAVLGGSGGLDALWTITGAIQGPSVRRYLGYANVDQVMNLTVTCPDGSITTPYPSQPWFQPSMLGGMLGKTYQVAPDGSVTGDERFGLGAASEWRYTWNFKPEREP